MSEEKTENYRIEVCVHCTLKEAHDLTDKIQDFADNIVDCATVLIDADTDKEIL